MNCPPFTEVKQKMKISGKMIKYKLTDQDGYTRRGLPNKTQWKVGKTITIAGNGNRLCSADVIHFYDTPLIAVLLNPIHANIDDPLLWEVEVDGVVAYDGIKGGTKSLTPLRVLPLPAISITQRIRFAIFCTLEFYYEENFVRWANKWLSGEDRSAAAAEAASAEDDVKLDDK